MKTLLFSVILAIQFVGVAFANPGPALPPAKPHCSSSLRLDEQQNFHNFVISTYRNDYFEGCLAITRNGGGLVFSERTQGRVTLGNDVNKGIRNEVKHPPDIPLGTDITGLGRPNLILNVWTGGVHCCFQFQVLELGDVVRKIATIDAEESDNAHFEDIHHNGKYGFVGWDSTFAYWHTSYSDSPAPQVILRFDGAKWVLDLATMYAPRSTDSHLSDIAEQVRTEEWFRDYPPSMLWKTMLDLIYMGHPDQAWILVDRAWRQGHVAKQTFLERFCGNLATSQYFSDLRPTLRAAPCKFDPRLAERE